MALPGPYNPDQGYAYWNDPAAYAESVGGGGNPNAKFWQFLPLIMSGVGMLGSLFGKPKNPGINTPNPVTPQSPGNIPMDQLMGMLPQFMQLFEGAGGQEGLMGMLKMLQMMAAQDYQKSDWLFGTALDQFNQGSGLESYLLNYGEGTPGLFEDVLGIDVFGSPGATSKTWMPFGPGGYYKDIPPPTGDVSTDPTGNPPVPYMPPPGGDINAKYMIEPAPGEGNASDGGAGGAGGGYNPPPGGSGAPSAPGQEWVPYGEGEGPGQWLSQTGPGSYGWKPKAGGFDPKNPKTFGLLAPNLIPLMDMREGQANWLRDYGVRGGETDRSIARVGEDYFKQAGGMRQKLVQDALQYVQQSIARKQGRDVGPMSGAAGQAFGGFSNYLQGLLGGAGGAWGQGLNYNSNLYNSAMGNYWNQQNFNLGVGNQNNQWWQQLMQGIGSLGSMWPQKA